eukprot:580278-Lingulodinium_polyedra.AAC.1
MAAESARSDEVAAVVVNVPARQGWPEEVAAGAVELVRRCHTPLASMPLATRGLARSMSGGPD